MTLNKFKIIYSFAKANKFINSKNLLFRNLLTLRTTKYVYTILSQWGEEERNCFARSRIVPVSIRTTRTKLGKMEITFIRNICPLTLLISKYIPSALTTCMPRPEDHQLWMELSRETNRENKCAFQLS